MIIKSFGHETILYHPPSGDTLILSATAVALIKRLHEGALEKQKLLDLIAQDLNYELDDSFVKHMDMVISDLKGRDIIASQ